MLEDQNTTPAENENIQADKQNPIPEESPLPTSSKEPMADMPVPAIDSTLTNMPPEALPEEVPEPATAQTPVSEPLASEPEPFENTQDKPLKSEPERTNSAPVFVPLKLPQKDLWKRFIDKVQFRKRKKLDRVMTLFLKKSKITNDEVEKFLHVSDATATRYLSQLEKEGKIKQNGKTGHSVFYSRI